MRDATLKQFRSLAATVKTGTMVGAAKELHVTPPAVAQQLRLLERSVGIPLLDRGPDGPRPTDAGREILVMISRVEADLEGCRRQLELIRDGKIGSVSFGAVSTAKYFAPQLLAAFWELHPMVDVKLVVGNRDEIIRGLATYGLDQVIMGRPPDQLDLQTSVIGPHPHVIVASPRHHLAQHVKIRQSALVRERFLVREQGSGTRMLTDRLFSTIEVPPPIAMEITSNETIKQAVMADLGVALISAHTVAAEIDDGRLVTLDVVGLPIMREWYAVRRSTLRPSPAEVLFWSFLTENANGFLPHSFGTANPHPHG